MPVFVFELRRQAPGFLVASAVVAAIAAGLFAGLYPVFRDARAEVDAILASYPPQFLAAFGAGGDVLSPAGFLTFSMAYLYLAAAIAGFGWGLGSFGRERRERCSEFLLAKPLARGGAFVQKLLSCLAGTALLTLVTTCSALAGARAAGMDVDGARLALAMSGTGGVALVFLAVGALAGVAGPRARSVSGPATAAGLVGFVLGVLPSLTGEDSLRVVSPFSWFAPQRVLEVGSFDPAFLALAATSVVVLLGCALVAYARGDVRE